ncbi:hypothetical protein [Weissella viridescens]|uniref:hypothetical protein n=1 Tax=Weissella viridescens TaxID=1629 RepID=UPI003AF288F1
MKNLKQIGIFMTSLIVIGVLLGQVVWGENGWNNFWNVVGNTIGAMIGGYIAYKIAKYQSKSERKASMDAYFNQKDYEQWSQVFQIAQNNGSQYLTISQTLYNFDQMTTAEKEANWSEVKTQLKQRHQMTTENADKISFSLNIIGSTEILEKLKEADVSNLVDRTKGTEDSAQYSDQTISFMDYQNTLTTELSRLISLMDETNKSTDDYKIIDSLIPIVEARCSGLMIFMTMFKKTSISNQKKLRNTLDQSDFL